MICRLKDIVQISAVLKENQASIFIYFVIKQGFTHRLRKGLRALRAPINNLLYNVVKKARKIATGLFNGATAVPVTSPLQGSRRFA